MPSITLEENSLRDGLQFEDKIISLEDKLAIVGLLVESGIVRIQAGSFVHPKMVPQMADTDEFVARIKQDYPEVLISGLVLNAKGLERALACGLTHVSMSVSASNTHNLKNVKRTAQESLNDMAILIRSAVDAGVTVRAGIQCALGCVYEGNVSADRVMEIADVLSNAGATELNLADSTGMGDPFQVKQLVSMVKKRHEGKLISVHLHDTRGLGVANMLAAYEAGAEIFDVSAGGMGGCPFIKGASGNVPTEDSVNLFNQMGVSTGVDLTSFCKVVKRYESLLQRNLPGHMSKVIQVQENKENEKTNKRSGSTC